ncbi:hypothetical protein DA89_1564 [Vibrio paracholerae]|nr:hypothetical protein DA89_1564 [Vibrio paracholerae]
MAATDTQYGLFDVIKQGRELVAAGIARCHRQTVEIAVTDFDGNVVLSVGSIDVEAVPNVNIGVSFALHHSDIQAITHFRVDVIFAPSDVDGYPITDFGVDIGIAVGSSDT